MTVQLVPIYSPLFVPLGYTMVLLGGQACICVGAPGLHKAQSR